MTGAVKVYRLRGINYKVFKDYGTKSTWITNTKNGECVIVKGYKIAEALVLAECKKAWPEYFSAR